MAPIYDTDIAESRWDKSDWQNYELWERVALRARHRRRLWVLAAVLVYGLLSSVPIVLDRWDKWSTLAASRRLAQEINRIKRDAGIDHVAYRLRFSPDGSLQYWIERAASCSDPRPIRIREGRLVPESRVSDYTLMTPAMGAEAGIPGLIQEICYDYLAGSDTVLRGESVAGFGIVPVKDLSERRQDRLSILLVNGPSAESTFD